MSDAKLARRFWDKVTIPPYGHGCWEWQAAKLPDGYGQFAVTSTQIERAHRVAWTLIRGPIPAGLFVLHRCDNPGCVNPVRHLFLGTNADNMADMVTKGRSYRHRGERNGSSKLREDDVRAIRRLLASGVKPAKVAEQFSITRQHVSDLGSGRRWRHLL